MGPRWEALFLMLLVASLVMARSEQRKDNGRHHGGGREQKAGLFILQKSKQVVKTEAGEVRVVREHGSRGWPASMHIGFVSMEPNSVYIPHYMDASLILFVKRGKAEVGLIHNDRLVERQLRIGDIYRIPAGSTFYMANTGRGQRLQIICSIDTSESLGQGTFQSFYIGGGSNPTSILSGFDMHTLTATFNVSSDVVRSIMKQGRGPIVYTRGDAAQYGRRLASLLRSKREPTQTEEDENESIEVKKTWTVKMTWVWRKLLDLVMWDEEEEDGSNTESPVVAPDSYNLYDRSPDFKNNYGWSIDLDEGDYAPLKHSGIGVYLVNLSAGAMMAPHVNPTATEYGVVLSGSGRVQVVFPNGSSAMDAEVTEGDVFWVPRYFPFCQLASRRGPMQFFGFTTSQRRNRPQFLVGASSVLRTMMGPELAAAFGTSEERFRSIAEAQGQSTILPQWRRGGEGEVEKETGAAELRLAGRGSRVGLK